MTRVAVLASGRGSNLQALIDSVEAGTLDAEMTVVISDNPEAQALERAEKHGIESVVVERSAHSSRQAMEEEIAGILDERETDLVVLAGYMRILGPDFVAKYYGRIINIHPSLLPAFPGLEAQRQALEYGVKAREWIPAPSFCSGLSLSGKATQLMLLPRGFLSRNTWPCPGPCSCLARED